MIDNKKSQAADPITELAELAGEMRMMRRMLSQASVEETAMQKAWRLLGEIPDSQRVKLGNKYYTLVADRVRVAREVWGTNIKYETELLDSAPNKVSMRCVLSIRDDDQSDWHIVATGHAEEFRDDGFINKKSAIENCETSCVGRALASFGLAGSEFASADEVVYSQFVKESAGDSFKIKDQAGTLIYTMPHGDRDADKRISTVRFQKVLANEIKSAPDGVKEKIWSQNEDECLRAINLADEKNKAMLVKIRDYFNDGARNG